MPKETRQIYTRASGKHSGALPMGKKDLTSICTKRSGEPQVKDCIVICMPTAQVDMARTVRKLFGKPVIWVVLWEYLEQRIHLTEAQANEIGEVRSLPRFYHSHIQAIRYMEYAELDAAQLGIEERLGISNNTLVVSYDRNFRNVHDYRTARELQLINLMFVEKLLSECSPSFVATGRECYLRNTLADTALRRGIPCGTVTMTRNLGFRLAAFDHRGQQMGMRESFDALMRGEEDAFDPAEIAAADAAYGAFLARPQQPRSVGRFQGRSIPGRIITALANGCKHLSYNAACYKRNAYDRISGQVASSTSHLAQWPAKLLRLIYLNNSRVFFKSPDLQRKYFYLPLHHEPEQTDMYYGHEYSDHEAFVTELSRRIPSDYVIYVKDHITMSGTRTIAFFKKLSRLYNVEFIHTSVDTFSLISNASAIVTVTGTAGWEGFMFGRPVVVLGDVFYNFLPGVLHANLRTRDFAARVAQYLRDFKAERAMQYAAVRACHLSSRQLNVPIGLGDLATEGANAESILRVEKELYDRWSQDFVEHAHRDPWWSSSSLNNPCK